MKLKAAMTCATKLRKAELKTGIFTERYGIIVRLV